MGAVLETIASLNERIWEYDRRLEETADELYPETKLMRQVYGAGALTALAFAFTLDDPSSSAKGRQMRPYLGWCPPPTSRARVTLKSASPGTETN
jgi:transposase